jgi:TPP-dependent 2-oxoacid decarboxylase
MIDEAIITALYEMKPVYLEIPVNINGQKIPIPSPISFTSSKRVRKTCAAKKSKDNFNLKLIYSSYNFKDK